MNRNMVFYFFIFHLVYSFISIHEYQVDMNGDPMVGDSIKTIDFVLVFLFNRYKWFHSTFQVFRVDYCHSVCLKHEKHEKDPSIPCRDSSQANTSRGSNDEIKFIFCRGTTLLLLVNLTFIAIQLFIYNANKQFHFHPTVIITIHIYYYYYLNKIQTNGTFRNFFILTLGNQ